MSRGTAYSLADPRRQVGEVLGDLPSAGVVRLSSQASWLNAHHSSLRKVVGDWCLPASSSTTLKPFWQSPLANVPPPAPEPIMTTTESSLNACRSIGAYTGLGLADSGGSGSQLRSLKPR